MEYCRENSVWEITCPFFRASSEVLVTSLAYSASSLSTFLPFSISLFTFGRVRRGCEGGRCWKDDCRWKAGGGAGHLEGVAQDGSDHAAVAHSRRLHEARGIRSPRVARPLLPSGDDARGSTFRNHLTGAAAVDSRCFLWYNLCIYRVMFGGRVCGYGAPATVHGVS